MCLPGVNLYLEKRSLDLGPQKTDNIQRYNLAVPDSLYEELQKIAKQEHTTILELIKKAIRILLLLFRLKGDDPYCKFYIEGRDGKAEIYLV